MEKRPVKMLIAGPRYISGRTEWMDFPFVESSINNILDRLWLMPDIVVSGGAIGADSMGEQWALTYKVGVVIRRPPYELYPENPKVAPLVRNGWMAQEVDFGIVFWNNSGGTKNMLSHMKKFKKPVFIVDIATGDITLETNDFATQPKFSVFTGMEPIHPSVIVAFGEYPLEPKEIR